MERRAVIRSLAAGTAIALVGGTAGANEHDTNGSDEEYANGNREPEDQEIHPVLGYVGFAPDEEVPEDLEHDHEVDLYIQPREDQPIPEFFFEPTGLYVEQGAVVRFNFVTPDHTVTAYHPQLGRQQRVPDEVPPFSSPVLSAGTFWLYRFDEPGVYDVLCAPHEIFGMAMRIVVDDPAIFPAEEMDEEGEEAEEEGQEVESTDDDDDTDDTHIAPVEGIPPHATAALVFADPVLDPTNIQEQETVSWDDLDEASKELVVDIGHLENSDEAPTEADEDKNEDEENEMVDGD